MEHPQRITVTSYERHGVLNIRQPGHLFDSLLRLTTKTAKLSVYVPFARAHRSPVNSSHKGAAEQFLCRDVILSNSYLTLLLFSRLYQYQFTRKDVKFQPGQLWIGLEVIMDINIFPAHLVNTPHVIIETVSASPHADLNHSFRIQTTVLFCSIERRAVGDRAAIYEVWGVLVGIHVDQTHGAIPVLKQNSRVSLYHNGYWYNTAQGSRNTVVYITGHNPTYGLTRRRVVEQKKTVYPKKYAHGFCFAVLCCGYTLTDFPISIRLTSLALWQSNDCPSASKATPMNMDKYFKWIHYERLHNLNKAKHNKTVCIFLGIYCSSFE